MISFVGKHRRWLLALLSGAVLLGLTATLAFGQKQPEAENPPSVGWKYLRLKKSQSDLCYSCHQVVQAQFALPNHHRAPEGFPCTRI